MKRRPAFLTATIALVLALGGPSGALAITQGTTAQGASFVSGGVGVGERNALERRKHDFNLRVVTAAKGSGAFLAGATVKITDRSGRTVLESTLDGPWLLVGLEPGEYTVVASHAGQRAQGSTTIRPGDHHEMILYLDVQADGLPSV
jgi:hypothetical protein